jgi:hypothetical protein
VSRASFTLILIVLALWAVSPLSAAVISNDTLFVEVDGDSARFFMSTVADGGHPLLFYDTPPSSFTDVYVNDDVLIYGGDRGRFLEKPVALGNTIESTWRGAGITVTQTVRFLRRRDTGAEDGVLITYALRNESGSIVKTGVRIVFDTLLGEDGSVDFTLPGDVPIEYQTAFSGSDIPPDWLSRSVKNPGLCLRGVLEGDLVSIPERVVFANYRTLQEYPWEVPIHKKARFDDLPYSRNDSAVAIYSPLYELEPQSTVEFSTLLGLCGEGAYEDDVEIVEMVNEVPETLEEPLEILRQEPEIEVPGEVVMKEPEQEVSPETATPEPNKLSKRDLERIKRQLDKIRIVRGTLQDINQVLQEINDFLATDSKSINRSELERIIESLGNTGG